MKIFTEERPLLDLFTFLGKMEHEDSVPAWWKLSRPRSYSSKFSSRRLKRTSSCSHFTSMDFEPGSQSQKRSGSRSFVLFFFLSLNDLLWAIVFQHSFLLHIHLQAPITVTSHYLFTYQKPCTTAFEQTNTNHGNRLIVQIAKIKGKKEKEKLKAQFLL